LLKTARKSRIALLPVEEYAEFVPGLSVTVGGDPTCSGSIRIGRHNYRLKVMNKASSTI
jgi:hypothetical protein